MRISLPSRFDSSSSTRSRSLGESSTAVVTVARTRPAATSARRSNSSSTPATSRTRFDSMSSFARFVASGSRTCGASAMSAKRCSVAMVGLVSTDAISGSERSSRTEAMRRLHSSTWPSPSASSKTAFAYLLAAAVATRHLRYRAVDQLPVLGVVERLADDLLGGGHDKIRNFAAHRLDRTLALGLDLFLGGLDCSLRLLFCFLLELLTELLTRLGRSVDHALGGLARVFQLHNLRIDIAREDRQHDQERDQLDDHRPVDFNDGDQLDDHRPVDFND